MAETFGIVIEIDPSKAVQGTDRVDKALEENEKSARAFEREATAAMREVGKAASAAAREQERAARAAAKVQSQSARESSQASRAAMKAQEDYARGATIDAERRAKERAQVEITEARKAATAQRQAAAQQKQSAAELTKAYRDIVGPAADYQHKLAQIIQLERQGAITAQQRARAVNGMQREMKQFSAGQQGGIRGGISSFASSQLGAVAGPAAIAGTAVAVGREVIRLGDDYITLSNKIRTATTSEAEMIRVRERLFTSANRARVDVTLLTGVYAQMQIATKDLGTSQGELIRVSELLAKATRGVGEQNKSAGLQQFGQALTKGKLQAEELMSIMENIPKVGVLLAQGMGMTVGELRKAAEAGKVGTQQMLDAIQRVGPEIEREFGRSASTSAESWTALKNQVLQTVGGFAEQVNLSGAVSKIVGEMGHALKFVGDLVSMQVGMWKQINDYSGGILGKIAAEPGIFGQIDRLSSKIATSYLFGAEYLEMQTEELNKQTAILEANTRELEGQLVLMSGPFYGSSSKDRDGLVTGYGITGNFLRQSADATAAKTYLRTQKDNDKAARESAAAAREAGAAWREWTHDTMGRAHEIVGGLTERFHGLTDSIGEVVEIGREMVAFNDNVADFGATIADVFGDATDMIADFVDTSNDVREVYGAHSILDMMTEDAKNAIGSFGQLGDVLTQQFGGALKQTTDALVDFAAGTEVSFRDMARSILIELAKVMAQMLLVQGIKAAFGTSSGGFGANLLSAFGVNLGNNATGGSYVVPSGGGGGGVDSVPIFARATPGERVTFTPPGASERGAPAAASNVRVTPIIVFDRDAAVREYMRSGEGQRMIVDAVASNPSALRAAMAR